MVSSIVFFFLIFSGEGEEPMTALDAERLAQGKRKTKIYIVPCIVHCMLQTLFKIILTPTTDLKMLFSLKITKIIIYEMGKARLTKYSQS